MSVKNILFDQSVFIRKNTPELVKALEDLGYRNSNLGPSTNNSIATTACTGQYTFISESNYDDLNPRITWKIGGERLDCKYNEELFLALAALTDNTDYGQWFKIPKLEIIPHPGYYGQQGLAGREQVVSGYDYIKWDKQNLHITESIKLAEEGGEDQLFIPKKLGIDELKQLCKDKDIPDSIRDDA